MNSMILESPTAAKCFNFGTLAGTNFHSMLKESIERFLIEVQKDSCDFTAFRSIFFRLLQSSIDPPLEVIWFYSALGYHEAIRTKRDVTDRIFAIRDLLHLLSAFSASCDGPKSMALLAPVVSELYHCLGEEKKLSGKVAKKFRKEIENLAEGVVSYISICSGRRSGEQELCDGYLVLDDIIRVWTVQHSEKVKVDHFSILFPFLSEQIRYSLSQQGRRGLGYLAGAVVAGAFLLSLSLKVQVDGLLVRPDSQKELRIWAVSSISMFQNYYFFDMLLRILLLKSQEPMLTARSTDEGLARNVLYDAVILVDYSFTNPGLEVENFNDSLMNLLMRRLIVTHEAIQIVRGKGDHNKAISYTNAFATSCVSNALIKWVTFQVGSKKLNKPNTNAPQGLLKWFLVLEKQGFKLFEDEISELLSKLAFEESSVGPMSKKVDSDSERTVADIYIDDRRWPDNDAAVDEEMETVDAAFRFDSCSERTDDDLYSDDKRWPDNDAAEDEEMETVDAAFRSAALSMKSEKSRERKKRKEKTYEEDLSQLKLVRYKSQDKSVKDNFNKSAADGMSSGSEVENPSTVDEMAE